MALVPAVFSRYTIYTIHHWIIKDIVAGRLLSYTGPLIGWMILPFLSILQYLPQTKALDSRDGHHNTIQVMLCFGGYHSGDSVVGPISLRSAEIVRLPSSHGIFYVIAVLHETSTITTVSNLALINAGPSHLFSSPPIPAAFSATLTTFPISPVLRASLTLACCSVAGTASSAVFPVPHDHTSQICSTIISA